MRFGIVHGSSADVLDPGQVLNGMLSAMHYAVTNTLTEVEAGGPLVPKLAVEWDASPDARVWIFKLRPGIKFHNGKTLTVDDVIAPINHHRGEGSTSSAKTLVDAVVDITSDGADRLTIELNSGDADFLFKLSSFNFPIYAARGDGSLAFEKGVGLGAYKLISFEPGVRAAFEKNRNYWDDTRGHFDSAELISIRDVTACTNALRTDNDGLVDQCNCGLAMWGADHASSSSPPPPLSLSLPPFFAEPEALRFRPMCGLCGPVPAPDP